MRNGSRLALALLLLGSVGRTIRAEPPPWDERQRRLTLPSASGPRYLSAEGLPALAKGSQEHWFARIGRWPLSECVSTDLGGGWFVPGSATPGRVVVELGVVDGQHMTDPIMVHNDTATAVELFVWDQDRVFGAVAGAKPEVYDRDFPHAFLAKIEPKGRTSLEIGLPSPGPAADARVLIQVSLAPTHEGLVMLGATWGATSFEPVAAVRGKPLSTVSFHCDGKDVPPPGTPLVLRDATSSIPPTTPEDTSDDRGAIWVDRIEIRAPMPGGPGVLRAMVELDDGPVDVRVTRVVAGTFPSRYSPAPDPVAAAKGADEVIVTTKATAAGAARLAAHRSANGVRTVAIPFADVVDRLGYGAYDPELVGRYLSAVTAAGTSPRFVVLAGDANRDLGDDPETTIPTAYGRTMYNGATASDRLLVRAGLAKDVKPPSVGRLPFRDAASMDAYVDRLIAYETTPPADASRRLLRFVTSEGRFGPVIDTLLERLFTNVVTYAIPSSYDVEVTFANVTSAYGWPAARFNEKVVSGLNDGALFYTYVGHGWAEGFDWLHVGASRFPILRSADVPGVDVKGTPPAMFVVACTTATFDDPAETGIGERLVSRPRGPLAYWGATRVCHPAWNSLIGRQIALEIFKDPNRRLGEVLDAAEQEIVDPTPPPPGESPMKDPVRRDRMLIESAARGLTPGVVPFERILEEGSWMYALLGDPAVRIALPKDDLAVTATPSGAAVGTDRPVGVSVKGPFADGATVEISIEVPRNQIISRPLAKGLSADDGMRARHTSSNDKAIVRAQAVAKGGVAEATLVIPSPWTNRDLFAKAWAVAGGDVHQGATPIPAAK